MQAIDDIGGGLPGDAWKARVFAAAQRVAAEARRRGIGQGADARQPLDGLSRSGGGGTAVGIGAVQFGPPPVIELCIASVAASSVRWCA
jgi:hypothetical protein